MIFAIEKIYLFRSHHLRINLAENSKGCFTAICSELNSYLNQAARHGNYHHLKSFRW